MDIVSHGLWSAAGSKAIEQKNGTKMNLKWAFFWGMFPDLFAFTIPVLILLWSVATGHMTLSQWPRPEHGEPPSGQQWTGLQLATTLYQYSHSLVVFAVVMVIVIVIVRWRHRRFPWEMLGWPLHILMDVPTHTYQFFPTPVFWPISQWRFSGYSWAHPWFLATNYGVLGIVFFSFWRHSRLERESRQNKK